MPIAIMSAMSEENAALVEAMTISDTVETGQRIYHRGTLWNQDVVVVFSHWGKVAAASTVTYLIANMKVSEVIFTGVAGAVDRGLKVGDVVIGSNLYQHDMDARPIIRRHEIPLLGQIALPSDEHRRQLLLTATQRFLATGITLSLPRETIDEFSLHSPQAVVAGIASGDQFISRKAAVQDLRERLPDVACVEMEGAAVAQVCLEFDIPFSVVRTISDSADEAAGVDFPKFIQLVARKYSLGILENLFAS